MVRLSEARGQALVEMTAALLVLVLLLGGIVEFGRIFHTHLLLTQAAREGVRVGVVGGSDSEIKAAVRKLAPQLSSQDIVIDPPPSSRVRGGDLTVTVRQNVNLFVFPIPGLLPNPYPVKARAVMRIE
ncbi:TadE/TadG family type IV pilus assembly protein [Desulfothermobacter acidiphilus]|uniref:TadE/TadG family type IV pilus assembly protein n=1 Tax=Desulfothermobacter acidiphilus TaxID=1938353 RepID=UPI003F8A09D8